MYVFGIFLFILRTMSKPLQSFMLKYRNMVTSNQQDNPILLFPGLGASRLLQNGRDIYPPTLQEYALHYTRWKHLMTQERTLKTLPLGDNRALDLCIPFYHDNVNYYTKLVQDSHIHTIPYDFRQLDNHPYLTNFFEILRKYIEDFQRPVELLCHSSGGLVAHWFLHSQPESWRKQWIHTVTHVNVPFGGVVLVLENCIRDDTTLNRYLGRGVFTSLGAAIWNLPDTRYLNHSVLTVNGEKIDNYFDIFHLKDLYRRYKENQHIIDSFKIPTGVKTYIMYSTTEEPNQTLEQLEIKNHDTTRTTKINSIYGSGDKVVSLSSLLVPKIWNDPCTEFYSMPNMDHSNIFR